LSGLARTLGLPGLLLYGTGVILGAGIYSVLGAAAAKAGPALWQSFLISALAALLTALSYAELATLMPKAGAEYVYLRAALPGARALSSAVGLVMSASGAATAATVSVAFAGYLQSLTGQRWPVALIALGVVGAVTALNAVGLKASARVNGLFTVIEILGLLLCIGVGFAYAPVGEALAVAPSAGVLGAAGLVFFSFLGFESIAALAEESKDPERVLPRAILGSLAIATTLYVLVALAAVALLDPAELGRSDAPLTDAVATVSGTAAGVLGAVALFSTSNTALVNVLGSIRILYAMGREGDLPAALGRVPEGRDQKRSPVVAVGVTGLLAASLLPLGEVDQLASVASLLSLVAFASVHVALLVLRVREPDRERPFRVPLAVRGVPVPPVLGLLATLGLALQFEPTVYAVGAAVLGLALAVGWGMSGRRL
jgi:APA family basic amino acid/polyamine antiporter